jgi:hypothetical protein
MVFSHFYDDVSVVSGFGAFFPVDDVRLGDGVVPFFDEDFFHAVLDGFDVRNASADFFFGPADDFVGHFGHSGEIVSATASIAFVRAFSIFARSNVTIAPLRFRIL